MKKDQIILNLVLQACYTKEKDKYWEIDNLCISAYEDATEYLAERGILEKINDKIFRLKKYNLNIEENEENNVNIEDTKDTLFRNPST